MRSLPWRSLIFFAVGSMCLAYPASVGLYTLYTVGGSQAVFSLSLLVHPVVFFLFGLWYFRETGAAREWETMAASAIVWTIIDFLIALALFVPVYARPIAEAVSPGTLLSFVVGFGALLLAGFISRPRAADPRP